jgi:transposase-like protein
METPKTLQEAIQYFSDYENCRQFMIGVRWLDGVVRCPRCDSEKVTYLENARLYRCYGNHPKQKFSLKVETVFEDSPIPLEKWLPAVWLMVSCKNGISSYELHRALGVTQKSAGFMLHRIRYAMQSNSFVKIGGPGSEVEIDETFVGGKARNMHRARRIKSKVREGNWGKTIVMGMLQRGGHFRGKVVPNRRKPALHAAIEEHVEKGAQLYTDEHVAYADILPDYTHNFVNHMDLRQRARSYQRNRELLEPVKARDRRNLRFC